MTTKATPRPLAEFVATPEAIRLTENAKGQKMLEGALAQVDIVNRNNRYYSRAVFEKAVGEVQGLIENGQFTGELDHPEYDLNGSLEDTAFIFTKLYLEGNLVKYEARLLDTPAGNTLKGLLEGGVRVGMSTRGTGSVKYEDTKGSETGPPIAYIQMDYTMAGADAVKVPSNEAGFARLRESVETRMQARQEREETTVEINTVEELREQLPELVQHVEESAKAEPQAALETAEAKVTELEGQLAQAQEQISELQAALDLATPAQEQLAALRTTLLGEASDDDPPGDDDVTVAVSALRESLEALRAELDAERAEKARLELEQALQAAFETAAGDSPFAAALRESIDPTTFDTIEALTGEIERVERIARRVVGDGGTTPGKGKTNLDEGETPAKKHTNPHITERSLKIAGVKVEG